jgi:MFS family permease
MSALRVADFRRLWLAGLVSDAGDWLLLVSLPIVVYRYTGSALGTATAFLAELVPPVLLAPVAGRVADRLDRVRTLRIASLAQAAMLAPLLLVSGKAGLPIVYAVIAVQAGLASVFDPTKKALLPTLVEREQLVAANSLIGLNENLGRLIGGPLGGLLLAVGGGLSTIVAVDAASFVVAVALLAGLGSRGARAGGAAEGAAAPAQGWRAALANRQIRGAALVAFTSSVAQGIFIVLFVVFVARSLHGGSGEIGTLRGVQAIGSIAGGVALAAAARFDPGRLTAYASIAFGLICLAIWNAPGVSTAAPLYVALFIAVGAPGLGLVAGLSSVAQRATVEGQRGKAFAALGVAMALGEATGIIAAGLLGDPVGIVPVLNAQGILHIVAGLIAVRWLASPRNSTRPRRARSSASPAVLGAARQPR